MIRILKILIFWSTLVAQVAVRGADLKYVPFEDIQARWGSVAFADLKAAAEKGDAQAQHYLGRGYADGRWGTRDLAAAVQWYELAAAQGFPNSQANLGAILMTGFPGVPKDSARALRLVRAAAETEVPIILFQLGNALAADENYAEAIETYQKAAAHNHVDSMLALADIYYYGKIGWDFSKCYEWLKKAADIGNATAMIRLARLLSEPHENFPERLAEAEEWNKKAQAARSRAGQSTNATQVAPNPDIEKFMSAQRSEFGSGALRDLAAALRLYLELADRYPEAELRAARIMENSAGPERNDARAMELYLRANARGGRSSMEAQPAILRMIAAGRGLGTTAENLDRLSKVRIISDSQSHFLMGQIFDRGEAVVLDMPKAVEHYTTATRWGSREAMNRLGELWREGVNGEPDLKEAARWFYAAALSGLVSAQYNIGLAFANGAGVPQDRILAFKWLTLAARRGEKKSESALATLNLTANERAEVEKFKAALERSPEEQYRWLEDLAAAPP
jgi:TPR repeat protein